MTREEEIERESVYHLNQYDYSYEEGEHLDLYIKGFTEGAHWADEHPNLESLWHNANEEPNIEYEIICQDDSENYRVTNIKEVKYQYQNGWQECVARECIVRWAYISDLLPNPKK